MSLVKLINLLNNTRCHNNKFGTKLLKLIHKLTSCTLNSKIILEVMMQGRKLNQQLMEKLENNMPVSTIYLFMMLIFLFY